MGGPLPVRLVANALSIREFVDLCSKLDEREKQTTYFRVLEITRAEGKLAITVKTTTGKVILVTF